jgi:hypothetical protein
MGLLARLPGGVRIIQLLGHMRPDERLASQRGGLSFPSPVGLGCRIDPRLAATRALAEFGFGFLEIGPITAGAAEPGAGIKRNAADESLLIASPAASLSISEARRRLADVGKRPAPILARIKPESPVEAAQLVRTLSPLVDAIVVPQLWIASAQSEDSGSGERPLLAALTADDWSHADIHARCVEGVRSGIVAGVVIDAPVADGELLMGKPGVSPALAVIRDLRAALGPEPLVFGGVGVHDPADAVDAIEAGADLVVVDSGLVFAGPGLPKRINDALLYRKLLGAAARVPVRARRPVAESWLWALLLGLSLIVGGMLALAIASTRVVLPYDETMTGLTRDQLAAINPRLLDFMKHDRVTLAGTMLAVGILYASLAWHGIRRGMHWAYATVATSALAGFFTFFAFLGFGYFDPFHAFVSAVLLQLTLLAVVGALPDAVATAAPDLHNDEAWRSHQWGQLLFVIHGVALTAAGVIITTIGMTSVFIAEDLAFLGTTAEAIEKAHPQLKPLVAHDRATFGGMLLACGLATLLPALWGFRRGHTWLWRAVMAAGTIAYLTAIAVHMNVGYTSHKHLLPAYGGLVWLWAGGLFSYPYMAGRDEAVEAEWRARIASA